MLYKKNGTPALSKVLFRNPTSEYRGTPFWAWNCQLEKDELLWQLEVMKKMGLGGAHMHVRTGMATPYLSDEHMDLVKACVEKCRDEEMLAWLYDEDRWPSGAAGGIVTKDKKYRARYLLFTAVPYAENREAIACNFDSSAKGKRAETGYLLACFDIVLDEQGCLKSAAKIDPEQDAEGTKWYVYVETPGPNPWYNNQTYVDTLNPEAIRRFIEVTYDRYLETVGEDFGGVVPAIFTDEPQFTRKQTLGFAAEKKDVILPWTEDVPETFRASYGEEIIDHLPELLWDLPEGKISTVRYHYHDHISERFTQAFADQCGDWCDKHDLMLTGHMMEEPTLFSQSRALGEAMRSYRGFQLPGIDMLCNRIELTTAKQAQSAAHQYGREGVMSELYGVTGWDFDFRGHKFQGDWQAALGITVRVQHLFWVSMKGEAKRDYPASIGYQSPWWEHYSYVEDHFARVNTALTRGKPQVRVGVIHPIESYWLHFGPDEQNEGICTQMDNNFQNLTDWLLNGSIDFDYICESLLPEQCAEGGAPLNVGVMAYDTVIVPACQTLRSTTLERLEAFAAAGGRLIFLGAAPEYENAVPSARGKALWEKSVRADFTRETVLVAVEPARTVDIRGENGGRTTNLIHQLRRDGEDMWLFIAHSKLPYHHDVPNCQKVRIFLEGEWNVEKYDTQTGEVLPMKSRVAGGRTVVEADLYDLDSLLLRYTPENVAQPEAAEANEAKGVARKIPNRVAYTLDEPNMYLLNKAEFALNDAPYRDEMELLRADNVLRQELGWPGRQAAVAQPWTITEAKAEHTVRLRFTVPCAVAAENVKLALEDAEIAEVFLNGQKVEAAVDGWYTDKSIGTLTLGDLPVGENKIEVILPFGRRTNVEWCYLLGNFGVRVCGEYRELTALPEMLGFGDVTTQGLAHYCGNITYHVPLTTEGGDVTLRIPHYNGTAIRVSVDGSEGYIAYPPYELALGKLAAGAHMLELTLLGNRHNGFGPIHLADPKHTWIGPNAWRTAGSKWTESYRLKTLGITTAPCIREVR